MPAAWDQFLKGHHDRVSASDDLSNMKLPREASPASLAFFQKQAQKCTKRFEEASQFITYHVQAAITAMNAMGAELGVDPASFYQAAWEAQNLPEDVRRQMEAAERREQQEREKAEKEEQRRANALAENGEVPGQLGIPFDENLPQAEAASDCVTVQHEPHCALLCTTVENGAEEYQCDCGAQAALDALHEARDEEAEADAIAKEEVEDLPNPGAAGRDDGPRFPVTRAFIALEFGDDEYVSDVLYRRLDTATDFLIAGLLSRPYINVNSLNLIDDIYRRERSGELTPEEIQVAYPSEAPEEVEEAPEEAPPEPPAKLPKISKGRRST